MRARSEGASRAPRGGVMPSRGSQHAAGISEAPGGSSLNAGRRDTLPLQQPQVQALHRQVLNTSGLEVFPVKSKSDFYLTRLFRVLIT